MLRTLQLGDNLLTEIPKSLGSLSHLTMVTLDNNAIREIPVELLSLSNLECLVLSSNEIVRNLLYKTTQSYHLHIGRCA